MDARKPSRRKTPPLAYCEYVSADPKNSIEVWAARLELIEVAKRAYPTFLQTLSEEVFPLYEKLAKAGCDFDLILWSPQISPFLALRTQQRWQVQNPASSPRKMSTKRTRKDKESDAAIHAALESGDFTVYRNAMNLKESRTRGGWSWAPRCTGHDHLTSALSKWAARFHIKDEWLMDEALRTLRGWYVAPDWRKSLRWNTQRARLGACSTGEEFEFHFNGWETELFTWPAYRESLRKRFEDKLTEYEKNTRELAKSCGLVRARRKYSPENLEWFVLYQFAGRSSTSIANGKYGEDPDSTILKGIKAAAHLIGWDHLRKPGSRGNREPES
jgi:hypothetical protein